MAGNRYKLFGPKRTVLWVPGTAVDIATAPSPATSGLSLVVGAGQGAAFAGASVVLPHKLYAAGEVMYVTARAVDTLTIVRARDATTAQTVVTGTANGQTVHPVLLYKTSAFDINNNIVTIEFPGDGDIERVYESSGINGSLTTSKLQFDFLTGWAGALYQTTGLYSDETARLYTEIGSYPGCQIDVDLKAISETQGNIRTRVRQTIWLATLQKPVTVGPAANNAAQTTQFQWSSDATLVDQFGRSLAGLGVEPVHLSYSELVAA